MKYPQLLYQILLNRPNSGMSAKFSPAMVVFPGCKINLGLHVLARRSDGYHEIETAMFPLNWSDALEVVPGVSPDAPITITESGYVTTSAINDNLVYQAWKLLSASFPLPPIHGHLHKHVPMGAGLGGGSADAAAMLKLVSEVAGLNLDELTLMKYAAVLGSDCAFFIRNQPALATGRGEILQSIEIDLTKYHILLVNPGVHSSTANAYASVKPLAERPPLKSIISSPVNEWRHQLKNDFEAGIFKQFPEIGQLKARMYDHGALYAAMTGSGSTVFGIFAQHPPQPLLKGNHYLQRPAAHHRH